MKTQKIAVMAMLATILLMPTVNKVFGADTEVVTDAVNGLSLITVFHFDQGDETINTFKYFGTESSGFARSHALAFKLEGIVGYDRPLLYQAINDNLLEYGKNSRTSFGDFDVDITFAKAGVPIRSFTYGDCQVKSYDVLTLTDAEESYNGGTKFAYIDSLKFDCRGWEPHNPVLQRILDAKKATATAEALKSLDKNKELVKQNEESVAKYSIQPELSQDFTSDQKHFPAWVRQAAEWSDSGKISLMEYRNLIRYLLANDIL